MQDFLNAISLLPEDIKAILSKIPPDVAKTIKEIRFRNGEAITLNSETIYYITQSGLLTTAYLNNLLKTDDK